MLTTCLRYWRAPMSWYCRAIARVCLKSLIEAAACARPLVATDVPGCREVITDGVDGLLVSARQSTALAAAVARLQDNRDLARRLGEAARSKALTEFDERIVIEEETMPPSIAK